MCAWEPRSFIIIIPRIAIQREHTSQVACHTIIEPMSGAWPTACHDDVGQT